MCAHTLTPHLKTPPRLSQLFSLNYWNDHVLTCFGWEILTKCSPYYLKCTLHTSTDELTIVQRPRIVDSYVYDGCVAWFSKELHILFLPYSNSWIDMLLFCCYLLSCIHFCTCCFFAHFSLYCLLFISSALWGVLTWFFSSFYNVCCAFKFL